nr:hypothetical protein [Acidovorax sp. SUPP3334]
MPKPLLRPVSLYRLVSCRLSMARLPPTSARTVSATMVAPLSVVSPALCTLAVPLARMCVLL